MTTKPEYLRLKIGVGLVLFLIVLVGMYENQFEFLPVAILNIVTSPTLLLILSLISLVWIGGIIFKRFWQGLANYELIPESLLVVALSLGLFATLLSVYFPYLLIGEGVIGRPYYPILTLVPVLYLFVDLIKRYLFRKTTEQFTSDLYEESRQLVNNHILFILFFSLVVAIGWYVFSGTSVNTVITIYLSILLAGSSLHLPLSIRMVLSKTIQAAADKKILIKDGNTLDRLAKIKAVVLEKGQIVTHGQPDVKDILAARPKVALRIAASLENGLSDPISQAILKKYGSDTENLAKVSRQDHIDGLGVSGVIEGEEYVLGSLALMHAKGVVIGVLQREKLRLENMGNTVLVLGKVKKSSNHTPVPGEVLGLIVLKDEIRPDAKVLIAKLKKINLDVWLLSGDSQAASKAIAAKVGLTADRVLAEITPDERSRTIRSLRQNQKSLMVVGDELALAMARDADVAVRVSDEPNSYQSIGVNLSQANLLQLPDIILSSRQTVEVIKSNFRLVYGYNSFILPIAAGLFNFSPAYFVPLPFIAALASTLATLVVFSNSYLFKRKVEV